MLFLTTNFYSFVSLNLHNLGNTVPLDFPHLNEQLEISRLQDAKRVGIWEPLKVLLLGLKRKAESESPKPCPEH